MKLTKEQLEALDNHVQRSVDDMHYVCSLADDEEVN